MFPYSHHSFSYKRAQEGFAPPPVEEPLIPGFHRANSDGGQLYRALAGGGLGGLAGMLAGGFGGLLKETFFTKPEDAQHIRKVLVGAALGGLAGTGIGATLGASNKALDWQSNIADLFQNSVQDAVRTVGKNTELNLFGNVFGNKPLITYHRNEDKNTNS